MVGATHSNVLQQQLEEVIDDELRKLEFTSLCKQIALKVVDRVQKIDNDHSEIKALYGELEQQVAKYVSERDNPPPSQTTPISANNGRMGGNNVKSTINKEPTTIILIDDDDDEVANNEPEPVTTNTLSSMTTSSESDSPSVSIAEEQVLDNGVSDTQINGAPHQHEEVLLTSNKDKETEDVEIEDKYPDEEVDIIDVTTTAASNIDISEGDSQFTLDTSVTGSQLSVSATQDTAISSQGEDTSISSQEDAPISSQEDAPISSQEDAPISSQDTHSAILSPSESDQVTPVSSQDSMNILDEVDTNTASQCSTVTSTQPLDVSLDVSPSSSQSLSSTQEDLNKSNKPPLILKITTEKLDETAETSQYSITVVSPVDKPVPAQDKDEAVPTKSKDKTVSNQNTNQPKDSSPHIVPQTATSSIEQSSISLPSAISSRKKKTFQFKANSLVYAKPIESDIWYEAELLKEVPAVGKKQPKYQVRFLGGQKLRQKILLKSIATKDPADSEQYEIGTRVVAGRPSDTVNTTISKKYKDISSGNNISVMFAGVVAELACEANRYRYLVFFDDGYAQYFAITSLYLVIRPSREVWNDVAIDCRDFIKEYLQEYPYRPLVCTQIHSTMQTEWNGEWWKSKVVSIDASLVKMLFDVDKRSEWIYRGTTRLEPLNNHFNPPHPPKKKKKEKSVSSGGTYIEEKLTHPQYGVSKYSLKDSSGILQREAWNITDTVPVAITPTPVIPPIAPITIPLPTPTVAAKRPLPHAETTTPATSKIIDDEKEKDKIMPKKLRVQSGIENILTSAKDKSPSTISSSEAFGVLGALHTAPEQTLIQPPCKDEHKTAEKNVNVKSTHLTRKTSKSPATVTALSPSFSTAGSKPRRGPHTCDESCLVNKSTTQESVQEKILNYLSVPIQLHGWKRDTVKKKTGWHRDVYYTTPCNKRLRNIEEVSRYLAITKCSNVAIDMFCFSSSISCRNQPLRPKPTLIKIEDLSGGKEINPIVCVNEINEELPNPIVYISKRMPAEDVMINTDPGFLLCCQCTDNCRDKTKCRCAQLTIESSKAVDGTRDENACYQYRRLKDTVTTGIYECNQNCSCSKDLCYNRVVQNGIQLRLQVFNTGDCGWGLRCINDIPKGTFVCTYTGHVLNEATANKEGMDFGDEYLAELDHIEVVEKAKQDYEEDVPELRNSNVTTVSSGDDSDSDSSVMTISSDSEDDSTENGSTTDDAVPPKKLVKVDNSDVTCDADPKSSETDTSSFLPFPDVSATSATQSKDLSKDFTSSTNPMTTKPLPNNHSTPASSDPINSSQMTTSERIHQLAMNPVTSGKQLAIKSTAKKFVGNKNNGSKTRATRTLYDGDKQMYVIDAKCFGNVGRFLNHSCSPNLFVQNVMVDSHDLRFPWVAFFSQQNIPAYTELTWDYNYEPGSVAGKTLICHCGAKNCKGRLL